MEFNGYEQDYDLLGSCWRSSSRSIGDRHCLRRVGVGPEHPHLKPSGWHRSSRGYFGVLSLQAHLECWLVASRQATGGFRSFVGKMFCCHVPVTALANDAEQRTGWVDTKSGVG